MLELAKIMNKKLKIIDLKRMPCQLKCLDKNAN